MKRALLALLFLTACKKPVDTAPIAAEAAGLAAHENELMGRRGALQRERTEISQQRQQLLEKRVQAGGAPQVGLDEEDKKLTAKEVELATEQGAVDQKLDELLRARAELVQKATNAVQGSAGADPLERAVHREQSVAEREKSMAHRETDVADREARLAEREAKEARREKESCSTVVTMAAPTAPPAGKKYTAHDVDPTYHKALKIMQERGILVADLPPGTSKLIEETKTAMKAGDFMRAKYAADQLLGTVEEIKIDRNFIAAKMARLSSAMRGKKLEGDGGKNTESLMRDATSHYSDGRFTDANQKINKLFAALK